MQKILLIAILITALIYLISRRIIKKGRSNAVLKSDKQGFYLLQTESNLLGRTIKNTFISAGVGLILFLIILFLAMKVKILLFLLPISIYLMGQLLLLNNQLKYLKDQRIWYQSKNHTVIVEWLNGKHYHFNLLEDVRQVKRVQAIQRNKQVMFGYYELILDVGTLPLPLLLADSPSNAAFFKTLDAHYPLNQKTALFPLI